MERVIQLNPFQKERRQGRDNGEPAKAEQTLNTSCLWQGKAHQGNSNQMSTSVKPTVQSFAWLSRILCKSCPGEVLVSQRWLFQRPVSMHLIVARTSAGRRVPCRRNPKQVAADPAETCYMEKMKVLSKRDLEATAASQTQQYPRQTRWHLFRKGSAIQPKSPSVYNRAVKLMSLDRTSLKLVG